MISLFFQKFRFLRLPHMALLSPYFSFLFYSWNHGSQVCMFFLLGLLLSRLHSSCLYFLNKMLDFKKMSLLGKNTIFGNILFHKTLQRHQKCLPFVKVFSLNWEYLSVRWMYSYKNRRPLSFLISLPIRSKRPGRFLVRTHGRCVGIGIQRYQKPPPVLLGRRNSEAVEPNREKPLH